MAKQVVRGEVWTVDLPVKGGMGHEQDGDRRALVVSSNRLNSSEAEMVVVLTITGTLRRLDWRVDIMPPHGVDRLSQIICEQPKSISTLRLLERKGKADNSTMAQVADRLRKVLGL